MKLLPLGVRRNLAAYKIRRNNKFLEKKYTSSSKYLSEKLAQFNEENKSSLARIGRRNEARIGFTNANKDYGAKPTLDIAIKDYGPTEYGLSEHEIDAGSVLLPENLTDAKQVLAFIRREAKFITDEFWNNIALKDAFVNYRKGNILARDAKMKVDRVLRNIRNQRSVYEQEGFTEGMKRCDEKIKAIMDKMEKLS